MNPDIDKINAVLKNVDETLDRNIADLYSISCEEETAEVMCICCNRANKVLHLMKSIEPEI